MPLPTAEFPEGTASIPWKRCTASRPVRVRRGLRFTSRLAAEVHRLRLFGAPPQQPLLTEPEVLD